MILFVILYRCSREQEGGCNIMLHRTYIRFTYKYNPLKDSEYYTAAAYIFNRGLMKKLDNESPKKANDSFGELCVSTKRKMSIDEMKQIVKYLWENEMSKSIGSYNGFRYKDLRPDSFEVSVEEVEEGDICQTSIDICNLSDNIIEFFAMQDINRIFNKWDDRKREIEKNIKTVADCL